MDTQTRHALKQDKFVTATTSGLEWIGENRSRVLVWGAVVVVVIGLIVAGTLFYTSRQAAANQLLGQAMDIYQTPLRQPNQPAVPGETTYNTAAERASAAYPLFRQAADKYGWLRAGEMALYFTGVTERDLGRLPAAQADLERATHAGNDGVSSLAKLALANLYEQMGKNSQAVSLFQDVIAHPTTTVPKAEAQLQLAELYETTEPAEARRLYAVIKDQDKGTDAAQIATQKLGSLK